MQKTAWIEGLSRAGVVAGLLALSACDDSENEPTGGAAGRGGAQAGRSSEAGSGSGGDDATELPGDFFNTVDAFTSRDNSARSVQVSVSGESLAEEGYAYSSTPGEGEPVFVDGWQVEFERYVVVIDKITVSEQGADPDKREDVGETVAEQRGPWVVDLHKAGSLVGAGGAPETAVPLAVLDADFDTTRTYAFSYETGKASFALRNTNLEEADRDVLREMIERGWSKYIAGTATYRGREPSERVDSSFQGYPTRVHFAFGLVDAARYVNCHNPEIGEDDEPQNRGVRPSASGATRAQLTFHTDHLFWDQVDIEGAPLRFDALAARVQDFGAEAATHELRTEDLEGVSPSALVDKRDEPVRDRGEQTEGYEPGLVVPPVYGTQGNSEINDLRSFIAYNNRAQGHLNSDGLCIVQPVGELRF